MAIFRLVDRNNNNKSWSCLDAIEDSKNLFSETEEQHPDACLLLFRNNMADNYRVRFVASCLSCSEAVALLERAKHQFLKIMDEADDL